VVNRTPNGAACSGPTTVLLRYRTWRFQHFGRGVARAGRPTHQWGVL